MYRKKVPEIFNGDRSILLHKGNEGLEDVNNWRPLTISSSVLRLYTSLLGRRVLDRCALNPRQRCFIAARGCSDNSFLLSEMINHAKKERRQLCVTFLVDRTMAISLGPKRVTVLFNVMDVEVFSLCKPLFIDLYAYNNSINFICVCSLSCFTYYVKRFRVILLYLALYKCYDNNNNISSVQAQHQ